MRLAQHLGFDFYLTLNTMKQQKYTKNNTYTTNETQL